MKALTVCQPYADLILLPESDPHHKRVENRTWYMRYRGPLIIHAGKSRDWLGFGDDGSKRVFGAILGIATVADCLPVGEIRAGLHNSRYPWIREHKHAEGPFCIVLKDCRRFAEPIPYRGKQGLFDVPWPKEGMRGPFYMVTLKTREEIEAEIPRERQGWWADVCPGQTMILRDATAEDIARCTLNEGTSRDPKDYYCEPHDNGWLVSKAAIKHATSVQP